jgi:hypothetical protein
MMLNAEWQMEHEIACCENGELNRERNIHQIPTLEIPFHQMSHLRYRVATFPQGKKETRIICGEFEPSVTSGALVRDLQMKKLKKENQKPKERARGSGTWSD